MDGWMDRWIDGWTDGWMDGWMDGWVSEWMVDREEAWIDEVIRKVEKEQPRRQEKMEESGKTEHRVRCDAHIS
jgi:hypothetical protein